MAIGLTIEEYVELKLMPPKHSDRAFVTAAEPEQKLIGGRHQAGWMTSQKN